MTPVLPATVAAGVKVTGRSPSGTTANSSPERCTADGELWHRMTVADLRFAKPLDEELIRRLLTSHEVAVPHLEVPGLGQDRRALLPPGVEVAQLAFALPARHAAVHFAGLRRMLDGVEERARRRREGTQLPVPGGQRFQRPAIRRDAHDVMASPVLPREQQRGGLRVPAHGRGIADLQVRVAQPAHAAAAELHEVQVGLGIAFLHEGELTAEMTRNLMAPGNRPVPKDHKEDMSLDLGSASPAGPEPMIMTLRVLSLIWHQAYQRPPGGPHSSGHIDRRNPAKVAYAAFSGFRSGKQKSLVFRTADGGKNWLLVKRRDHAGVVAD